MKPANPKASLRCAVYTRVSTEHGLEQEFNSLDNQREASEAYIKSQAHEGWRLMRDRYDDGGFSGGSMERPALKKLLDDVRARRIDVIVVYKVDRLTRSLADFAKLVVTASAMAATIQDTTSFAGPREFAAFLGLTPKQNSSGGKPKLGRISKMGNRYLRKLLVVGAHAVLFHRKPHTDPLRMWAKKLIDKKPFKLVAVALANKMARIAFAILRGKTVYREIPA
jgi:hypothetical protein